MELFEFFAFMILFAFAVLGVFLVVYAIKFIISVPNRLEDISKELRLIRIALEKDDVTSEDDF